MVESQNPVKKNKKVELSEGVIKPRISVVKDFVSPNLGENKVVTMEKEATSLMKGKSKGSPKKKKVQFLSS